MLYVVATPIGNLEDITLRALRILKEADIVLAEDTRVAKKLLAHFDIATPLISYHQQSRDEKKQEILGQLQEGKSIALVTDSGTPGISDPGNELIAFLLEREPELQMVPIPGPSAVAALASISGFPMNEFLFLAYPPHKKGRKAFFEEIVSSKRSVIFYESPHRILKSLSELNEVLHVSGFVFHAVVGRELTKQFETVYRGSLETVIEQIKANPIKGEFAVAVFPH